MWTDILKRCGLWPVRLKQVFCSCSSVPFAFDPLFGTCRAWSNQLRRAWFCWSLGLFTWLKLQCCNANNALSPFPSVNAILHVQIADLSNISSSLLGCHHPWSWLDDSLSPYPQTASVFACFDAQEKGGEKKKKKGKKKKKDICEHWHHCIWSSGICFPCSLQPGQRTLSRLVCLLHFSHLSLHRNRYLADTEATF